MSHDRLAKAGRAKVELGMTEAAFDMLGQGLLAEMMQTSADQSAKREKLFFAMRGLVMAKKALIMAVQDGDMANASTILAEAGLTSPLP